MTRTISGGVAPRCRLAANTVTPKRWSQADLWDSTTKRQLLAGKILPSNSIRLLAGIAWVEFRFGEKVRRAFAPLISTLRYAGTKSRGCAIRAEKHTSIDRS